MSPIGKQFRDYTKNYPALVNNTTIDWFMRWPTDALIEVANKYLKAMDIDQKYVEQLAEICSNAHQATIDGADQMEKVLKRIYYVTPTNFIELLKGYDLLIKEKKHEIGFQMNKLSNGLSKLDKAREDVHQMTGVSEEKKQQVTER